MDRIISCENLIAEIMFQGFKKAEDSFSRFLGTKVFVKNNIQFASSADILSNLSGSLSSSSNIVLTTDLMGEFAGKSYLFLTKSESEIIHGILGKQFKSIMSSEFLNAMLLEIDNIVSAAVITEISNQLKITLYGGVPGVLQVFEGREFSDFRIKEFRTEVIEKTLFYMTNFQLESYPEVELEFAWKLHPKVLELVLNRFGYVSNE